ncbi:N-alpha-acetyltransferase 80 isoform X2 [Chrysoperla carnea]|nr:N-alpha-acetyltransferase 80 isoform X2 [Chrysoperla carnea]XP_044729037.1 N-alpha-acetyltransferase 80 isoform X2 [Chrysoperla carnea]XP_044729038.1 N-alpha-acetyltransferase 80 isoform X2 [Chrysoperla carnea]
MACEDLIVCPLHRVPERIKECCQLINSEWKRSETARIRSLECSSDNLPTSLILLKNGIVVGHCKLSRIPTINDACFVESVVIAKLCRGFGLGKYLMKKTEEYCRTFLKLNTIYLSTRGQENFYAKLGYENCEPVSIYGSCTKTNSTSTHNNSSSPSIKLNFTNCPPPPPMPLNNSPNILPNDKTFMKKHLNEN